MTAPTADLLDKLGAVALECRALIREMHEAQRDLRQTIKEAHEAHAALHGAAEAAVAARIEVVVKESIDELGKVTGTAMRRTEKKIMSEFEKLARPLYESFGLMWRAEGLTTAQTDSEVVREVLSRE